jgi:hypothetical protein
MVDQTTAPELNKAIGRARLRREQAQHDDTLAHAAAEIAAKIQNGELASVHGVSIETEWGTLVALRPASIMTPNYQRNLKQHRVRKMSRAFDPRLYGVILVTVRGGKPSVIDGQHRIAAAIQAGHGDEHLPALVIPTATYREEAELFVRANHRETTVPASTGEIFHARMEQGDERALDVARVVTESGFQIDFTMAKDYKKPEFIRSVATLERIYRHGGPDHLADVLKTIGTIWGDNRQSLNHWMLAGFHQFIYRYHDLTDRARLQVAVRSLTPEQLTTRALMTRIAEGGFRRTDSGIAIGKTLKALYEETPGRKLPAWEEQPVMLRSKTPDDVLYNSRPSHTTKSA